MLERGREGHLTFQLRKILGLCGGKMVLSGDPKIPRGPLSIQTVKSLWVASLEIRRKALVWESPGENAHFALYE